MRGGGEECAGDGTRLVGHLRDEVGVDAQFDAGGVACCAVAVACVSVDGLAAAAWHREELLRLPQGEEIEFGEDDGEIPGVALGRGGTDEAIEACEGELKTDGCLGYGFDVEEGYWKWLVDGTVLALDPFS